MATPKDDDDQSGSGLPKKKVPPFTVREVQARLEPPEPSYPLTWFESQVLFRGGETPPEENLRALAVGSAVTALAAILGVLCTVTFSEIVNRGVLALAMFFLLITVFAVTLVLALALTASIRRAKHDSVYAALKSRIERILLDTRL